MPALKDLAAPEKPKVFRIIHGPVDKQKLVDIESQDQFSSLHDPTLQLTEKSSSEPPAAACFILE